MSITQAVMQKVGHLRYGILAMLFAVAMVNYADRATLSLAGPLLIKDLGLSAASLGVVFSAFAWTYMLTQVPSGWALDRFGSRLVYFVSLVSWSVFTLLQGGIVLVGAGAAVFVLFALRAGGCGRSTLLSRQRPDRD